MSNRKPMHPGLLWLIVVIVLNAALIGLLVARVLTPEDPPPSLDTVSEPAPSNHD